MSKRVLILKGLPGSGKSTWAKKLVDENPGKYKRVSKDMLRDMLDNGKWSGANEKFILKVRDMLILSALEQGYHPVVDDTNLAPKHIPHIEELVKGKAIVEVRDFTDVPLEVCLERDRNRQNYVGEQVIRKMYKDFLQPAPPILLPDPLLSYGIISDMDGTLALIHDRNPYDAALCEQDILNEPVARIVRQSYEQGDFVVLVSGRRYEHRPQTERWLAKHEVPYHYLLMRENGDNRKDSIVKQEIYEKYIKGKLNIRFVLDDRNQVVNLWRSLGLTCLQVAEGDY